MLLIAIDCNTKKSDATSTNIEKGSPFGGPFSICADGFIHSRQLAVLLSFENLSHRSLEPRQSGCPTGLEGLVQVPRLAKFTQRK